MSTPKLVAQELIRWFHLLWFGLVRSQADYNHYKQCDEGQQHGEVQVMDIFQHSRPVVLLVAQRCRVNEIQQHADAAHHQADSEAPEHPLREES